MLKRISFEIEVLTPAFVGGHEPRKLDEYTPLRPHTVRGLLRWWFRAATASLLWPSADTPHARQRVIASLSEAESSIFGNTNRASNLVVLAPTVERNRCRTFAKPDPRRSPGLRYLGYGLFEGGVPEAVLPHRSPGAGAIEIPLGLRRQAAGVLELLGATVWLWVNLGGVGARSRRGYGSLRLVKATEALGVPRALVDQPSTPGELASQLQNGIAWATDVFTRHLGRLPGLATTPLLRGPGPHPELRTLYGIEGNDSIVVLAGMFSTGTDALERMGRLFQSFRSTLERHQLGMPPLPDYFAVKAGITARRPPTSLDRAAFGLPLPFYFRSLQGAKATFQPVDADRLASPLLLRVHALKTGAGQRYVGTLINLVGRNFGRDRHVHPLLAKQLVERGAKGQPFAPPSGDILRQFTQWAKAEASKAQARQLRGLR